MNSGISVIICCYNSAERLSETIKHIALQKIQEEISWELIIVNNNSSDNTSEIALKEISSYKIFHNKSKIVDEPQSGLSHARQKGVNEARYNYIIFCDDDNWLEESYLQIAYEILENNHKIAAVGGQSKAISNISFPDWWEDYKGAYAVGKQAEISGNISARKYLWGSGLGFRKALYLRAFKDLPSLLTDRKGNELSSGGDSEICMRFLLIGYQLYYDERLKFKHFIEPYRLTWNYRKKLYQGFGEAAIIFNPYIQYIDILKSSTKNKILKLIISIVKIIAAIIFKKENFYTSVEANNLYFLTNIHLAKTSSIAKVIKKLKT